jgi:hypothetical protein
VQVGGPGQRDRAIAEKCGEVTEEIVDAWIEWFRDPQFSATFRNKISVQIMEFAIGRPAMQVAVDANSRELKLTKVIHLVRWLPPDPNDRSIEIAPEPD